MTREDALVPIGAVVRAHGLAGELRVHPFNPSSTLLFEVERVILRKDGKSREHEIRSARDGSKGAVLLVLEGCADRTAAEALRGSEVCVPRATLPPLGPDEWYHVDLVGLGVFCEDGSRIGEVRDVISYPTIDCLLVASDDGLREVPLREPWLLSVELDRKAVVVSSLDDLPVLPAQRAPKRKRRGEGGA